MCKFDLEANSDCIVPLFTGDVEDEATMREKTSVLKKDHVPNIHFKRRSEKQSQSA